MTDDSRPYLDPELLARVSYLELRAREIVEGLISGRHRSPFRGQSVEFAQHREYAAGDDTRDIDWNVWAKSDRLYIKQYEEETNLRTTVLLDASESMSYGSSPSKYDYACSIGASLAYLLLRQSDAVGMVTFDQQVRTQLPRRNQQSHMRAILHAMVNRKQGRKTDLEAILKQTSEREMHRGLVILISDLLADTASVVRGLRLLRQRRHDVIVFHVLHDDELNFLFEGTTRFEGLEGPDFLVCDPRSLRAEYLQSLERYLGELRRVSGETGIDYRLVRTSEPVGAVLASLLHERLRG